jgi:ketosteroid isomerase-like protein
MCPGASVVFYVSRAVDDLDKLGRCIGYQSGTTAPDSQSGTPVRRALHDRKLLSRESNSAQPKECCFAWKAILHREILRGAMSQENVELVLRGFEAFARDDLDGVMELMDPDVEWAPVIAPMLGVEPVRGKDALRRFFTRDLVEGFDDFEARPLSIEDLGDNVLVNIGYVARGRASGVPVSLETFALIVMRGGKLTSLRDYDTKAEALEAAGLSE